MLWINILHLETRGAFFLTVMYCAITGEHPVNQRLSDWEREGMWMTGSKVSPSPCSCSHIFKQFLNRHISCKCSTLAMWSSVMAGTQNHSVHIRSFPHLREWLITWQWWGRICEFEDAVSLNELCVHISSMWLKLLQKLCLFDHLLWCRQVDWVNVRRNPWKTGHISISPLKYSSLALASVQWTFKFSIFSHRTAWAGDVSKNAAVPVAKWEYCISCGVWTPEVQI